MVDVARHDGPAGARQGLLERVRPHDPGVVTDGCTRNLSVRESLRPNMLVMGAKETSGMGEARCSASVCVAAHVHRHDATLTVAALSLLGLQLWPGFPRPCRRRRWRLSGAPSATCTACSRAVACGSASASVSRSTLRRVMRISSCR